MLCSFPSKFSLNLHLKNAYKYSFVYSLLQVLLQSCFLSLCAFCLLTACLNLHLLS